MTPTPTAPRGPAYRTVIFDCDSTLSAIEGIEELAHGHRAEVGELTEAAMRGVIPLEEVYTRRLALVQPTRAAVDALGRLYISRMVPDARATCRALAAEGIAVRIISGGLLPAVLPLAAELGVPPEHVAAVDIHFDAAGNYASFDQNSPLARSGGKLQAIRAWLPALALPIMMVGDGSTDLETKPLVNLFVAFAGVVDRPNVTTQADIVIRTPSLAPVLALALGDHQPQSELAKELLARSRAPNNRGEV